MHTQYSTLRHQELLNNFWVFFVGQTESRAQVADSNPAGKAKYDNGKKRGD
jgi:hypothetical protein